MSEAAPVPPDLLAHAAFVRRLARSLLADAHAAEDVVQETLTRRFERPPARGGDLRAWLARVARNFAYRRRRTELRRGERERASARPEVLPPVDAPLERTETLQRVVDAVRALEEPYRATILARFYEDLPPRAIAAREGVAVETVNTRLKRGLERLRLALARDRGEWRDSLGLLAGESPCLPPHAGEAALSLAQAKMLAAVAAATVLVWGLWSALQPQEPRLEVTLSRGRAQEVEPARLASVVSNEGRRRVPSSTQVARELSGRVLDENGAPVVAARVYVLGHHDPFGERDANPRIGWNALRGRAFPTDAEGRWRAVLPDDVPPELRDCRACHADGQDRLPELESVLVTLQTSEAYEPLPEEERWVAAPARDVDFVVHRMPTGTIEIRVVEGAQHQPVDGFKVAVHGGCEPRPGGGVTYPKGFRSQPAQDSLVRCEWRVEDPAGAPLHVILTEPTVGNYWSELLGDPEQLEQEIRLLPGETEQVLFVLPQRGVVRGIVIDERGAPVPDALVFFGEETRARGDEPFKPLRVERIRDGARTGPDGWYELRGDGERVTALHADFSGTSVRARDTGRIVLGARGAIRGRLLEFDGRPAAGATLYLDGPWDGPERARSATTDATGSFLFERVEAGAHALWRDTGSERGELLLCVRVTAGAEAEVELRLGGASLPELDIPSLAPGGEAEALIVGLDRCFGFGLVEDGRLEGVVPPGRYWLATSAGIVAPLTVEPGAVRVEVALGEAELRVRASKRVDVQVVPADADAFTRLAAARAYVKVLAEQPALFRLRPGRYLLVGEAGLVLREVEVPPGGAELVLD